MILTRVKLDTDKRQALKALANRNVCHGIVESSQTGERERLLWRIDRLRSGYYLLILSRHGLDHSKLAQELAASPENVESNNYQSLLNRAVSGSTWNFRLAANPTFSIRTEDGDRGKVISPYQEDRQMEWLRKQAEKFGFRLDAVAITGTCRLLIKKATQSKRVSLQEVIYEGVLTVTDTDLFRTALTDGIGRGKAYGMGLLTLMAYYGKPD